MYKLWIQTEAYKRVVARYEGVTKIGYLRVSTHLEVREIYNLRYVYTHNNWRKFLIIPENIT